MKNNISSIVRRNQSSEFTNIYQSTIKLDCKDQVKLELAQKLKAFLDDKKQEIELIKQGPSPSSGPSLKRGSLAQKSMSIKDITAESVEAV